MIRCHMVESTYSKTHDSTGKKTPKGINVRDRHVVDLKAIDSKGDKDEDKRAEKVRVYVDRFIVKIE